MGLSIKDVVHPDYAKELPSWQKFRSAFLGGRQFIEAYLEKYSRFETQTDFDERKKITYCPAHAKGAVQMILNALFQRLVDVQRDDGGDSYQDAVRGRRGGVDLKGRTMNTFMGEKVLPDLLALRRIYVYVDAPEMPESISLAESMNLRPYLYTYTAESVPSWSESIDMGFDAVLVKRIEDDISDFGLPNGTTEEWWLFKRTIEGVIVEIYNENGDLQRTTLLNLPKIPLVKIELLQSLMQDIADYQIAMLQMASTDVNFLTRSNFAIWVEQYDPRYRSFTRGPAHPGSDGTTSTSQTPTTLEARHTRVLDGSDVVHEDEKQRHAGSKKGVGYQKDMDRPGFVNPSPEPTEISIRKQEVMAQEVRNLVDLALSSLAARYASGKSKMTDQLGLEAGLSYIGLVLEQAEREIAEFWAMYVGAEPATVKYPLNYSLRTDEDRRQEAKEYADLGDQTTSATYKREISKRVVEVVLGHRLTPEEISKINSEIDSAPGTTSDAEQIESDHQAGLVSDETASVLRGYAPDEAAKAQADHARRAAAIVDAQTRASERGVPDLDPDKGDGEKNPEDDKRGKGKKKE